MTLPDTVVLFGAGGFIGRNIVEELRGRTELVGVTASGRPVPGCTTTVTAAALADLPALPANTSIIHVAAVRYVASQFSQQQAEILSTNTAITDLVYRFALSRGIRELRVASSSAVYPAEWRIQDDARSLDLNAWPHDGEAAYAWSKRWGEITAELWHRRAGLSTISLRLTNPYGPFDTLDENEAHVATAFAIRSLGDTVDFEVRGDPEAERDFVYSGDVAHAFAQSLALQGVQATVNCAFGETTKVSDLAIAAMRAAGKERRLRTRPPPVGANAGVKARRATAQRLRDLLPELRPFRSVAQGMQETVGWYRDALH